MRSAPAVGVERRRPPWQCRAADVWAGCPGAVVAARSADADRVAMRVERREQLVDAGARRARCTTTTRGAPVAVGGASAQRQHLAHLARGLLGERQVALADGEDVGDLEHAGLDRLHVVAEAGRADDDARVGERDDRRLRLAGADRLDDDAVEAAASNASTARARRARQAAEIAARPRTSG